MNDLISRQMAIDEIEVVSFDTYGDYIRARNLIEDLPSAQAEQKAGRWIIKYDSSSGWYRVTCSECGEDVTSVVPLIGFFPNCKALWDYCPECGAKMEE